MSCRPKELETLANLEVPIIFIIYPEFLIDGHDGCPVRIQALFI